MAELAASLGFINGPFLQADTLEPRRMKPLPCELNLLQGTSMVARL